MTMPYREYDVQRFREETTKVVRAKFHLEVGNVALILTDMIPVEEARRQTSKLTSAAFRKGYIVGLSFASDDPRFPDCPYDQKRLPNFMRGNNDPRDAWREGSRMGQRVRSIVLCDYGRAVDPGIQYREYKAMTPEMRGAYDALPQSIGSAVVA